jgi:rhodanese-related sulfurtransferase
VVSQRAESVSLDDFLFYNARLTRNRSGAAISVNPSPRAGNRLTRSGASLANDLTWRPLRLTFVNFISQPTTLMFAVAALASGGMLIWTTVAGRAGSRAVSTLQATQLMNSSNALVIDLRAAADYASGTITAARNLPAESLKERIGELARFKARPVILVCAQGQASARAISEFTAGGFTEVYNLAGGVAAWKEAGLPLVKGLQKDGANSSGKKEKV